MRRSGRRSTSSSLQGGPIIYYGEVTSRTGGGRIATIRNHAPFAIYLRQSSTDPERHLAAGETSHIFSGMQTSRTWYARVPEGAGGPKLSSFEIEINAWT